jgi:hypothetical protein
MKRSPGAKPETAEQTVSKLTANSPPGENGKWLGLVFSGDDECRGEAGRGYARHHLARSGNRI